VSEANAKALARHYNDGLRARGVTDREWFVNASGELRMRWITSGQHRFDLGEKR